MDESEWTVFENTHEPIIDQDIFDNVQHIREGVCFPTQYCIKADAQTTRKTADINKRKKQLVVAQKRASELEKLICKIYEDNALGKLPDNRYAALDAQYAKEQDELNSEIADIETAISGFEERKDRLHQNYLRRKASGKQKAWEEQYKAKRKAIIDAEKAAIRAEDMAKGVYILTGSLPHLEPQIAVNSTRTATL